jgi:two-component system, NarL family, invasion response regulator UvrY
MRILLVDDHAVVRAGLRGLLAAALTGAEVHEAGTGEEALAQVARLRPGLVVLDLNLPGLSGLELLRRLLREDEGARILVLSMHAEAFYAARAIEAGARGYMSKNAAPEELHLAVRKVADGGRYIESEIAQELALLTTAAGGSALRQLTERELEIVRLLADGRSMTEIAAALGVSYKTVANGCSVLKSKLGITRTADLIRLFDRS